MPTCVMPPQTWRQAVFVRWVMLLVACMVFCLLRGLLQPMSWLQRRLLDSLKTFDGTAEAKWLEVMVASALSNISSNKLMHTSMFPSQPAISTLISNCLLTRVWSGQVCDKPLASSDGGRGEGGAADLGTGDMLGRATKAWHGEEGGDLEG